MSKKYERGPDKQLTKDGLRDARLDALAIVEAELHQRIYEGRYPVMPIAVRKYGPPRG